MGYLGLLLGTFAIVSVGIPGAGKYIALGLGLLAGGVGLVGYQRGKPGMRLGGAAGLTLGILAILLGGLKIGLTLGAMAKLESLLSAGP
jgi:hypothetical protein